MYSTVQAGGFEVVKVMMWFGTSIPWQTISLPASMNSAIHRRKIEHQGGMEETEMDCFGLCAGKTWYVSIEKHKRNRRYRDSK